jgi:hypothetical protein
VLEFILEKPGSIDSAVSLLECLEGKGILLGSVGRAFEKEPAQSL